MPPEEVFHIAVVCEGMKIGGH